LPPIDAIVFATPAADFPPSIMLRRLFHDYFDFSPFSAFITRDFQR
jgi:hypothetical protein